MTLFPTPSDGGDNGDDNFSIEGPDDAPQKKSLSGGAIFGIIVGSFAGTLLLVFAGFKGYQEYALRSTHTVGSPIVLLGDGQGTPTKVPPPSLFEKMQSPVMNEKMDAAGIDDGDGPMDSVGII